MTGRYHEAFEAMELSYCGMAKDFDHVFDQYEKLCYAATLNLEADTLVAQSESKYIPPFAIFDLYVPAGNRPGVERGCSGGRNGISGR